jgi:hypothetical protein
VLHELDRVALRIPDHEREVPGRILRDTSRDVHRASRQVPPHRLDVVRL